MSKDQSPESPSQSLGLFSELKRRKVFRAAGTYLVVAWLVIQIAAIVLPTFEVPPWSMRLVIIMASLGFPLVVVLAWAFELTPEGLKQTPDVDEENPENTTPVQNRKRNMAAFALGAVVPSLGFLLVLGILILSPGNSDRDESGSDKSIAVLPFANLSADEENAFFASGVHEDILTHLARIEDLRVISRTSVMRYQEKPDNLRIIGEALGAHYIVEGSVRRAGDDVRITVQLIDAKTDEHLWAENFDRKMVNVFERQSSMARDIASILNARISPEEEATLSTIPTTNVAAYDAYLKARGKIRGFWINFDELRTSIALLETATELDPQFIEAWGLLATAKTRLGFQMGSLDNMETEAKAAKEEALATLNVARGIEPDHRATLMAEGFYFLMAENDFVASMRSINKAVESFPNDIDALGMLGWLYQRIGQIDKSLEVLERAYSIDKGNFWVNNWLPSLYQITGQYDKLVPFYQNLVALDPEMTNYLIDIEYYQFLIDGTLESFEEFEHALHTVEQTERCNRATWREGEMTIAMLNGEFDAYAERWHLKWQQHYQGHGNWLCPMQLNEEANHAALLVRQGKEESAMEIVEKALLEIDKPIGELSGCLMDKAVILPKLRKLEGDPEEARRLYREARLIVEAKDNIDTRAYEKGALLETADVSAPEEVYDLYRDISDDLYKYVTLQTICANPWSYPNLLKDPRFQAEVRRDGRFVEFLEHYGFLKEPAA